MESKIVTEALEAGSIKCSSKSETVPLFFLFYPFAKFASTKIKDKANLKFRAVSLGELFLYGNLGEWENFCECKKGAKPL